VTDWSSRAVVISSQMSTSGSARTARARAARCSSPPERRLGGRAAVIAATPRRASVATASAWAASGRRPRRRSVVRATCSSTGRRSSNEPRTSCQRYWTRRFCSRDRLRRTGSGTSSSGRLPVWRSCRPARQRASVVLPLPERPTTPRQEPARTLRLTSAQHEVPAAGPQRRRQVHCLEQRLSGRGGSRGGEVRGVREYVDAAKGDPPASQPQESPPAQTIGHAPTSSR
jgi:hypothetical protein